MSQENIQEDTPQSNEQTFQSLEEAVFGSEDVVNEGSSNINDAFTSGDEGNTQAAPETGQPAEVQQESTQPEEVSNDVKRYQYWQSQADKLKSENANLRQSLNEALPRTPQDLQQPEQYVEEGVDEFPAPPDRPERPRNFNREEAYADSNSESARYLDEVEEWRDNINEYNTLKTQYQSALMEEKFQSMENDRIAAAQRQQAAQQRNAQANQIKEHVMGHYGMNESETADFMQTMSNPNSLNIDNLVQLYRIQKGGAQQQPAQPEPSTNFQQVQKAQQIPSPMGVMPSGQSNTDGRSMEDKIMDTMIGNFNSKNPWT